MNPENNGLEWGSHLPALFACLANTVGPVIEVGVGHFSTPILHAFCVEEDRQLISVEQDRGWFEKFENFRSKNHGIYCGEYSELIPLLAKEKQWAVSLIDNSPGGNRRACDFSELIKSSVFVVVHDYHLENEEAIGPLLKGMNTHITRRYSPPTLVASRIRTIPQSILCL